MTQSPYADVYEFHRKFEIPIQRYPAWPDPGLVSFRVNFIEEELSELRMAVDLRDMAGVADALVDLVYVTIGMAVSLGIPFDSVWAAVHAANMKKRKAMPGEGRHATDVVKPEGWQPPNIREILHRA